MSFQLDPLPLASLVCSLRSRVADDNLIFVSSYERSEYSSGSERY